MSSAIAKLTLRMMPLASVLGCGTSRYLIKEQLYSVYPRVVATVITVEPRGLTLIRTPEGATYEVLKGTTWRVGDTVACNPVARTRVPWETLNCRKTSRRL